jgi:hypothetical protein
VQRSLQAAAQTTATYTPNNASGANNSAGPRTAAVGGTDEADALGTIASVQSSFLAKEKHTRKLHQLDKYI